jgi:hypothetical protein
MARIGWVEGIGYCASLLVFCSFYMKRMIPLRGVAIASNVVQRMVENERRWRDQGGVAPS